MSPRPMMNSNDTFSGLGVPNSIYLNSTEELYTPPTSPSPPPSTSTHHSHTMSDVQGSVPSRPPRRQSSSTSLTTLTPPTSPKPTHTHSHTRNQPQPTPSRSSSLRRKPVPDYIPMPATHTLTLHQPIPLPNSSLPPTHPFASPSPTPHSGNTSPNPVSHIKGVGGSHGFGRGLAGGGGSMKRTNSDSPLTPGIMKMEDDLFFQPPGRTSTATRNGPPPPRRTFSPVGSVGSAGNGLSRSGSTRSGVASGDVIPPPPLPPIRLENVIKTAQLPKADGGEMEITLGTVSDKPLPAPPIERGGSSGSENGSLPLTPNTTSQTNQPTLPDPTISSANAATRGKTSQPTSRSASPARAIPLNLKRPIVISRPSQLRSNIAPDDLSDDEFSIDKVPSKKRLLEAGTLFLRDEEGHLVSFASLFPNGNGSDETSATKDKEETSSRPSPSSSASPIPTPTHNTPTVQGKPILKTVLFFIRHFWCGQCQDYTFASLSLLDPVALAEANIRVVVISNGSWKIIKSYKKLFNCPFPIYVDGPRKLYQLLG
jgi:hypothetical protein